MRWFMKRNIIIFVILCINMPLFLEALQHQLINHQPPGPCFNFATTKICFMATAAIAGLALTAGGLIDSNNAMLISGLGLIGYNLVYCLYKSYTTTTVDGVDEAAMNYFIHYSESLDNNSDSITQERL